MMQKNVISFMNMKGGVGKTTICVNIAAQLASKGKKVLVIDIDPQMNASQYMLKSTQVRESFDNKKTIYSLYREDVEQDFSDYTMTGMEESSEYIDLIISDIRPRLDLICGDLNMTKVKDDGSISDILAAYIVNNELKEKYDFIFIDCPPTQSVYTTSAFKASDYYVVVIKPDYLSTIGLSLFVKIVSNYNKNRVIHGKLESLGIIANLTQKTVDNYHESKLEEIQEKFKFRDKIYTANISNKSSIAKSSEKQEFMNETAGCKQAIKKLAKEFLDSYNERTSRND